MRLHFLLALACFIHPLFASTDCANKRDYRSNKSGGFVVADLKITGTSQIDSSELSRIVSSVTGTCVNDDSDLEEILKAGFQDRGYFLVEVQHFRVKPLDALANPKPVDLEAEVAEGQRYRLGSITFAGNHGFSTKRLRMGFPLHQGDLFERHKISSGIATLMGLYSSGGYLDSFAAPDTNVLSNGRVDLLLTVHEGKQYHMGGVYFQAKKELSEKLRQNWKLAEGQPFDRTYLAKFIDANSALLPKDFTQDGSTRSFRDCDEGTVQVVVQIDLTPPAPPAFKDAGCPSEPDADH